MQPEYDRRLKDLTAALLRAQVANEALHDFQNLLDNQQVMRASSMLPPLPDVLGNPRDPNAIGNRFFQEAAKAGLLSAKELPAGARL